MSNTRTPEFLRAIPSVDDVLSQPTVMAWRETWPRFPWTALVRRSIDALRNGESGAPSQPDRPWLIAWTIQRMEASVDALRAGGLKPVLNGTGVVLHTNLGRAPLGERAAAAALRAMRGYVSLEVDIESGERSRRGDTIEALMSMLTGAEASMVVNNNAAAVYLAASSFSPPGRVIVSRGELVEIGGSFRLPEILRHAAAEVIEVGTTNRTYPDDYQQVARAGDVLLKVDKSNYEIEGFAHEASLAELVAVGERTGAHVVFDMGSGAFFDFAAAGLGDDRGAASVVASGVDAVTMSGDKLLGGLQAGIVAGKRAFVDRLKQNPLRRAVRIDKVTVAALQAVARSYLFGDALAENPALAMITGGVNARERAQRVADSVAAGCARHFVVSVGDDDAAVGGGSLTGAPIASVAVVIRCADERRASRLVRDLRRRDVPLFARVRGDEVRINMTTILPNEDEDVTRALLETLTDDAD
jgi:L-seryl-tRNA(Ser) seleniumtransferase